MATHPKGFPLGAGASTGWCVFDADVPYPVAVMFECAIEYFFLFLYSTANAVASLPVPAVVGIAIIGKEVPFDLSSA